MEFEVCICIFKKIWYVKKKINAMEEEINYIGNKFVLFESSC